MSRTKLLKISSDHRTSGTNSNFQVHMGNDHTKDIQNIRGIYLVSAMISNTHYNINSTNNSFVYNLNGGGETLGTIPEGQYNITTLIDALESVLTGVTITVNTLTNKLNFETDGVTTLDMFSENDRPTSTLSPYLGLFTSFSLAISSNVNMDNVFDLSGLDLVNIHMNITHGNCLTTDSTRSQSSDIIASIPITSAWGVYNVFYDNSNGQNSKVIYDNPHTLTYINVRLTDKDNKDIVLQHETLLMFRLFYD